MRQVLLRIPLDTTINIAGLNIPIFGAGLLLSVWLVLCAWWTFRHFKRQGWDTDLQGQLIFEVIVAAIILKLPAVMTVPPKLPGMDAESPAISIFGYGAAMVVGFLLGTYLAVTRAKREGIDPTVIWDIGMTVLISGVIGARMFWIFQNAEAIFVPGKPVKQVLFDLINLPNGGLVLYGGVMLGIATYILHCRRLKISMLRLADILIPSIFVGEMFGRIGCFLNGCCYGAQSSLAWPFAVQFPESSPAYNAELRDKLITAAATCSLPLHPAQLYSSAAALILATLTWFYYPHRTRNGEVLLLGWLLYPISRFCLEIIRVEPPGIFNTRLSIAQEISIGLFISGLAFWYYLSRQPRLERPARQSAEATLPGDPVNGPSQK